MQALHHTSDTEITLDGTKEQLEDGSTKYGVIVRMKNLTAPVHEVAIVFHLIPRQKGRSRRVLTVRECIKVYVETKQQRRERELLKAATPFAGREPGKTIPAATFFFCVCS